MPIFTFLIINGFFKTKDFKRYIFRLTRLAVFTQIIISVLGFVNVKFIPGYVTSIYMDFNIVFSFVLSLLFINAFNNILIKKCDTNIALFKNIGTIIIIPIMYCILKFNGFVRVDYGFMVLILAILFYLLYKIKEKNKYIYIISLIFSFVAYTIFAISINPIYVTLILVLPLLLIHNDEIKSKHLKLQKLFYSVFWVQHMLLYITVLIYNSVK